MYKDLVKKCKKSEPKFNLKIYNN